MALVDISEDLDILYGITRGIWPRSLRIKRNFLNRFVLRLKMLMRSLGQRLTDREITPAMWESGMRELIRKGHRSGAALLVGGEENYTEEIEEQVQEAVEEENGFLGAFLLGILAGDVAPTRIPARSGQYSGAVRATYHAIASQEAVGQGFDLEENVLNPADHCEGAGSCIAQTELGQVPVGTLIPIGSRVCGSNCQCNMRYINSSTGEVQIV